MTLDEAAAGSQAGVRSAEQEGSVRLWRSICSVVALTVWVGACGGNQATEPVDELNARLLSGDGIQAALGSGPDWSTMPVTQATGLAGHLQPRCEAQQLATDLRALLEADALCDSPGLWALVRRGGLAVILGLCVEGEPGVSRRQFERLVQTAVNALSP